MLDTKRKNLAPAMALGISGILAMPFAASAALASPASDYEDADAAATAAAEAYETALEAQDAAQERLSGAESRLADQERKLEDARIRSSQAVVALYKNGDGGDFVEALLGTSSLGDAISLLDGYSRISEYRMSEAGKAKEEKDALDALVSECKVAKADADAKVEEASAAQEAALEARDEARAAYEASQASASSPSSTSGAYAATSSSWNDEQSAKEYIIYRESRGDYSATNGRYYGAYQLDSSYLDGDFSPEHQDEVAEEYVRGRYGSWSAAAEFWDSHNWY